MEREKRRWSKTQRSGGETEDEEVKGRCRRKQRSKGKSQAEGSNGSGVKTEDHGNKVKWKGQGVMER